MDASRGLSQRLAIPSLTGVSAIVAICMWTLGSSAAPAGPGPDAPAADDGPPSPASQSAADVVRKSAGCLSCHTQTDAATMHVSSAVQLGCTDCHGGYPDVALPAGTAPTSPVYRQTLDAAHVQPRYPDAWHYPSSANPQRTYTLLNRERPAFVRFINPSDYRVAKEGCGACHQDVIEQSVRSLHATGAMLWGGASYNNGILPFKPSILGESYTSDGVGAVLKGPRIAAENQPAARAAGILPELNPLPAWESVKPGDIFRVFERGGRNIGNLFPETGLPDANGKLERIEEPGRTSGSRTEAREPVPGSPCPSST